MNKQELLEVFNDTREISNTYLYEGTKRTLNVSEVYEPEDLVDLRIGIIDTKPIVFTHKNCVNVAHDLAKHDITDVAIFNSCDIENLGGVVNTQENTLCLCTNLYEVLNSDKVQRAYYQPSKSLPEFGNDKVVYCRDVIIIRDSTNLKQTSYRLINIICCSPPTARLQKYIEGPLLYNRIYYGLSSAILNKDNTLVIGPWGCETSNQDVEVIAEQFALSFNIIRQCFDNVIFAISDDKLYQKFIKVFKREYKGTVNER